METRTSIAGPFARALIETPLIEPRALDAAMSALMQSPNLAAEPEAWKKFREAFSPSYTIEKSIAVIQIRGILVSRPSFTELYFYGAEDTEKLTELIAKASRDKGAKSILLDIDSPGGYVVGIAELGDAVRLAAKKKPVVAFSSGMMCSAAYWVGSQATEIVATRSSIIGSIGVYAAYYDYTARLAAMGISVEVFKNEEGTYKAAGVTGTQLTDEQRAHIQAQVQEDFETFKEAILATRPDVPDDAMRGQTFNGRKAVANNLADHTGTLAFAMLRAKRLTAGRSL